MKYDMLKDDKILISFPDGQPFYQGILLETTKEYIKVLKNDLNWCNPHYNYLNNINKDDIQYRVARKEDMNKIENLKMHRYFDKKSGEEFKINKRERYDNKNMFYIGESYNTGLVVAFIEIDKDLKIKDIFTIQTYRALEIEKKLREHVSVILNQKM